MRHHTHLTEPALTGLDNASKPHVSWQHSLNSALPVRFYEILEAARTNPNGHRVYELVNALKSTHNQAGVLLKRAHGDSPRPATGCTRTVHQLRDGGQRIGRPGTRRRHRATRNLRSANA